MRRSLLAATIALGIAAPAHAQQWNRVDEALGLTGTAQPGGVQRYSFPRTDMKVTLDGVEIKPALALGSWLAFQQVGQAAVMGDLVLTQDEINPVMSKLVEHDIAVTAIHNHVLRAEPATMYMHVSGHGDAAKLAGAVREALSLSKTPLAIARAPAQEQAAGAPDATDPAIAKVEQMLGHKGKMNSGVYQVSVPRAEQIRMHGMGRCPTAWGSVSP